MRKTPLVFRLSVLVLMIGICSLSALANQTFSVTSGAVQDVVIDSTKAIIAQVDPGVMPIPEPTSVVLLGSGVVALLGKKIRRRFKREVN